MSSVLPALPLRSRRALSNNKQPYSVRAFFSSIVLICILVALSVLVSARRPPTEVTGVPTGHDVLHRDVDALNHLDGDAEVCNLPRARLTGI